jgi:hypothetical protein
MAEREVKLGLMTYMDEQGRAGRIGFQGDTVKVHEDDLARFDELNVQPGGDEPFDPRRRQESMITGEVPEEEAEPEPTAKKAPAKKAT